MITDNRTVRKTISMKDLFDKMGIPEKEHAFLEPNFTVNVRGREGYKPIRKFFRTHAQNKATITLSNGMSITCGHDHQLYTDRGWVKSCDLQPTDNVHTDTGVATPINCVVDNTVKPLYDISVEEVHSYYSNGILSHNSWALATIGANAARTGKRVVHYTLELNENYVGLRYDTIFTGIEPGNIVNHPETVRETVEKIAGDIIIKYYPPRSITVHTLHAHIENLIENKLKPDLILVDYADLMRSVDRADARYQELGAIYEELRGLSGELGIPCWTASQTQRASLNDDVIGADKIAESYNKIMTADLVISLSRKLEDKINHTGRAHIIKNRFGADGITLPVFMNTSVGKIEIYDENSSKGVLLKKQMQAGESMLKKTLAKKFADLHDDLSDDL
jgi:hypothetical protein